MILPLATSLRTGRGGLRLRACVVLMRAAAPGQIQQPCTLGQRSKSEGALPGIPKWKQSMSDCVLGSSPGERRGGQKLAQAQFLEPLPGMEVHPTTLHGLLTSLLHMVFHTSGATLQPLPHSSTHFN